MRSFSAICLVKRLGEIFKIHLSTHNEDILDQFDLERLAKDSPLFSGAEIEQLSRMECSMRSAKNDG